MHVYICIYTTVALFINVCSSTFFWASAIMQMLSRKEATAALPYEAVHCCLVRSQIGGTCKGTDLNILSTCTSDTARCLTAPSVASFSVSSAKVQQLSPLPFTLPVLFRNVLGEIQQKATNKGPLVLVWMMATLEPVPVTYGHGAWLRAHKCYSLCMLCQPMAHGMDGQFRTGGQAYPQHYMRWVNRAQTQRNTPITRS